MRTRFVLICQGIHNRRDRSWLADPNHDKQSQVERYRVLLPLTAAWLCATSAPSQAARPAGDVTMACAASLAFLQDYVAKAGGRPLVFSTREGRAPPYPTKNEALASALGDGTDAVPGTLLALLAERGDLSAVKRCPDIRHYLRERGMKHGRRAVEGAIRGTKWNYRAEIVSLGLAVVSADGNSAILLSSRVPAPFGGSGSIHVLRRDPATGWRLSKSVMTWIS